MKKHTIINILQEILEIDNNSIASYVAREALEYSSNPEEFFQELLSNGCITGMITGLIYYSDTHKFYDYHYEEIEELRFEYENSTGCTIDLMDKDLKNTLAWFGFEQTAYKIALQLELDL